jgi:hypothetical protein
VPGHRPSVDRRRRELGDLDLPLARELEEPSLEALELAAAGRSTEELGREPVAGTVRSRGADHREPCERVVCRVLRQALEDACFEGCALHRGTVGRSG